MKKQDILLLYEYNRWANSRILNTAAKISSEQFLADATYPHGGLRGTLTHTLYAEWLWRRRWQGESPTSGMTPEDFPTLEGLTKRWLEEDAKLMASVSACTQAQLDQTFQYKNTKGKEFENVLWQVMAHVVNHGTQHRSEAAAMLTDANCSPGDIDLILFLREQQSEA
jgi:uncharacterized damage-inducible protein DinB